MASYNLKWKSSAERELRKFPAEVIARLVTLAESLAEHPYQRGARKLAGSTHSYRVRTGDYRLVYTVRDDLLTVEIARAGHRKDVYR